MSSITTADDPYRRAMDLVIAAIRPLAYPLVVVGTELLGQVEHAAAQAEVPEPAVRCNPDDLLARFSSDTAQYLETLALLFAEAIRRQTLRGDVRALTTEALAAKLRQEGFGRIQAALHNYAVAVGEIDATLGGISTAGAAVEGALVGGGLQVVTTGRPGKIGALAGAALEASIAESVKEGLRQARRLLAPQSVAEVFQAVQMSSAALLDMYVTYVFGDQVDFVRRDAELERSGAVLVEVVGWAQVVTHWCGSVTWALRRLPHGESREASGCLHLLLWFIGVVIAGAGTGLAALILDWSAMEYLVVWVGLAVLAVIPAYLHFKDEPAERRREFLQVIGSNEGIAELRQAVQGLREFVRSEAAKA